MKIEKIPPVTPPDYRITFSDEEFHLLRDIIGMLHLPNYSMEKQNVITSLYNSMYDVDRK